jgi:hypothetical protein
VAYETMAALLPEAATLGLRNAADVMLKSAAYSLAGPWGVRGLGGLLVGGAVVLIARDVRRSRDVPRAGTLGAMFLESILLSVVFGLVIGTLTARLLGAAGLLSAVSAAPAGLSLIAAQGFTIQELPVGTRIMLSLGAGVYEELLFRVLLVGALALGARRVLGWRPAYAGVAAAVAGALLFSLFHYVGPYGDPWSLPSFTFRFLAGLAFSALFLVRGFGITAWTHALYDIWVLVLLRA